MMIKTEPTKTVEEAFKNACRKNGLSVKKRKRARKSMSIRDEDDNIYDVYENLAIRKKPKMYSSGKKSCVALTRTSAGVRIED